MPFIDIGTLPVGERLPGWKGRTLNSGTMTFVHYSIDAGAAVPEHCHSNEEVWTVLEGELEVTVGGDSVVAKPGFVAIVPPFAAHSVKAVTKAKAIVTDSPVRLDASGGRRGVVAVDFVDGNLDSFALHNRGKSRVVVREVKIEVGRAAELPAPSRPDLPAGELPALCVLEAGERHAQMLTLPDGLRDEFYVRGVIVYDDDFGERQQTNFCRLCDGARFANPRKPGYNYGS
jgi:mannose-6-phosphate isomerase-like protein (cupin superfamily)